MDKFCKFKNCIELLAYLKNVASKLKNIKYIDLAMELFFLPSKTT